MAEVFDNMAIKRVKAVIQLRRGLEREWIEVDPVLLAGEPAYSIDTGGLKIGNGELKWSELPYITDGGGGGGTTNYNSLTNLPKIEGHTLMGDKSFLELGLGDITQQDIDDIIFGG